MTYKVGRCRLRQLLAQKKMTQRMLAQRLNITPQQLQHYVQNHHIMSIQTAKNISIILECSIEDLYEWHFDDDGTE